MYRQLAESYYCYKTATTSSYITFADSKTALIIDLVLIILQLPVSVLFLVGIIKVGY